MGDFIAENFIIIVIIVGGILSLLKNKSISSDEDKQGADNPTMANSPKRNQPAAHENPYIGTAQTQSSSQPYKQNPVSIEEQKQKQLENLQSRMGTSSMDDVEKEGQEHKAKIDATLNRPEIVKPYHHEEFKEEIKGKLNRKGLIDSIVMAEVLGPPRAKKPYSSIITKKK